MEWIGVSTFSTFVWDGAIGSHMACLEVENGETFIQREEEGER